MIWFCGTNSAASGFRMKCSTKVGVVPPFNRFNVHILQTAKAKLGKKESFEEIEW